MSQTIGILRFLGTNCDRDIWQAVEQAGLKPEWLWYQDRFDHKKYAGLILPGGFSYGDYLRCGALAAKAPAMKSVSEAADHGTPVMGICNGFQILCDSGLLPGALVQNDHLRFVDQWSELELANSCSFWGGDKIAQVTIPIAHGEGRFYEEEEKLKQIEDNGQVWWRYRNNPNGSVNGIAGVMNKQKNVAGLMPHPERAIYDWMGGRDGLNFFETLV